MEAEAALDFAGGKAVAGRRAAGEELAQQGCDLCGPRGGMIAARGARKPGALAALGAGAQIVGVEFVEPSAAQAEFRRRGYPAQFVPAKGGKDFTNERRSEAVDQLLIVFFIAARVGQRNRGREPVSARRRDRDQPFLSAVPLPIARSTSSRNGASISTKWLRSGKRPSFTSAMHSRKAAVFGGEVRSPKDTGRRAGRRSEGQAAAHFVPLVAGAASHGARALLPAEVEAGECAGVVFQEKEAA